MFEIVFSKQITGRVFYLKVHGIRGDHNVTTWDTPIDYMLAKHFVDRLNECGLPEEELFEATKAFLVEVERLGEIGL